MDAHCQCRAVHFKTPLPQPLKLYHCHCSHCRAQSASAFGTSAIFPTFELPVDSQPIAVWSRLTSAGVPVDCFFCKICGTRLAHGNRGDKEISIKGGCIDALDWKSAAHVWCADKVANLRIPAGVEAWVEEPNTTPFQEPALFE